LRLFISKLPPSVTALLLQLFAFLLILSITHIANFTLYPLIFALISGLAAAVFSYFAGLARWWLAIQLLFAPALVVTLKLNIPSGIYLTAFLAMLLVYWSTFRSQVPLYLSSKKVWQTLEELLPPAEAGKSFSFMDIGSGLGGVLTHLATVRPDGHFSGIENAPLPYILSSLRIKLGNYHNCTVHWSSLWACNLAPYDIVFAYLSPAPMEKLWNKARQEMHPGSLFISNSFAVRPHPPQYSITLDDMHHSTLHIWHM
jgi:hypothetical protein